MELSENEIETLECEECEEDEDEDEELDELEELLSPWLELLDVDFGTENDIVNVKLPETDPVHVTENG